MTSTPRYLPCPFCGSADIHLLQKLNHREISCFHCGAIASEYYWNRREAPGAAFADAQSQQQTTPNSGLSSPPVPVPDAQYQIFQQTNDSGHPTGFTTPDEAEAAGRAEYRRVTEGEG